MATLNVPDATYQRLEARAAALGTTADALALPALEQAAGPPPPAPFSDAERQAWLAEFLETVRRRADRYPPGFELDISREAMYEGCGNDRRSGR